MALAAGLQAFADGEVQAQPFDGDQYNRSVMDEFIAATFGDRDPAAEPRTVTSTSSS